MRSAAEIEQAFRNEFGVVADRFIVVKDLTLDSAQADRRTSVNSPGVYVFWKADGGVIKVGMSLSNSKSRALQHIRGNTKNDRLEMEVLKNDASCYLLLFNVRDTRDLHWIASLEYYLEHLEPRPLIHSIR